MFHQLMHGSSGGEGIHLRMAAGWRVQAAAMVGAARWSASQFPECAWPCTEDLPDACTAPLPHLAHTYLA